MTCRTVLTRTASATALICALSAGPAAAELTGAQVWQDWKSYMNGFGSEVSGTESQTDGTLTISDVVMTMQMPDDEGRVRVTMPTLTFIDNPDGTVSVGLPQTMPMFLDMTPAEGEPLQATISYAQTEPVLVVAGDPNDMTYTYDAQAVDIALDALEVDGETIPPEQMRVGGTIADISSVTRMQIGDLRSYVQDMTAGELTYDVAFVVPEEDGGGTGNLSGAMQGLTLTGSGELPLAGSSPDMNAMLEEGMAFSSGFSYAAGSTRFDMRPPDGPLVGTTSSDGGTIEVAMGPGGLTYDVTQANLSVDLQQVPDVPFPLSLQMARAAFNVTTPLRTSDEPQDFAFGFTLGEFTISDAIWNLFDAAGQLPRDPATISVDLTGQARMLADMMDPEATAGMDPGTVPVELHALDINKLLVSAVGAEATGTGAFTFDTADTTMFNGMPKPQGKLDLRVEGANALIDTLVQIGLLPQEQAMGARMMMGMFGVPQADDVLTSTIEITEEGYILANGQRLQ
jgi:hypothetical protein